MNLLQINTKVNTGSTGRIAEEIGKVMLENGHQSTIAFGRGERPSLSRKIKIGDKWNVYKHVLQTRLMDIHGFASQKATKQLIREIEAYQPDVVGIHNLHGYYIHVGILFEYLKANHIPVVWTFHDCWPFTGHCSYFDRVDCQKWKTHCGDCPLSKSYPKSWFRDRSYQNFEDKRETFTSHPNLTIVTPSRWLKGLVQQSFLQEYPVEVIHNGIDLQTFRPVGSSSEKRIVLGVAGIWTERKGLADFKELRKKLDEDIEIVLIGLSKTQIENLPEGITGIERTESVGELAKWYSRAAVFVNPTYVDNFPTTNIEALACGTPVITYDTGGSPEAIDSDTGFVVDQGNLEQVLSAIQAISKKGKHFFADRCRERALKNFDKNDRYKDYLNLYKDII